jgi:hypothetical protein
MREAKESSTPLAVRKDLPPFSRGHSSASQSGCSHASGRRRDSFCPHHFCPCGVVQSTCLPLMQEITGAKPVRGRQYPLPSKHCQRCIRSVSEFSSVQLRVRAPQSSQRSSRHHKPAPPRAALGIATILPLCSSLRISFVKKSCRSITGWRLHSFCSRSPMQRHDVENVASAGATPAASTSFTESKPQQTGTRLLPGYGEVATTSGSTNSLPRGVTAACRALTPLVLVRIQARQPIPARW